MIDRYFSPKGYDQPYLWFANYGYTPLFTEFEDSGIENKFDAIDKNNIKEFGLLGRGVKLSYDTSNGIFDIYGHKIEFWLNLDDGEIIHLTEQDMYYNDIITFKSAKSLGTLNCKKNICTFDSSTITGYFFGYKHNFISNDIEINSKIIFALPMEDEKRFGIRLVLNKDVIGNLAVIVNGEIVEEIPVNIKNGEASEIEWKLTV